MRSEFGQLTRYAIVGVGVNALFFVAYLGLTTAGVGHIAAMTTTYALGTVVSFALNKEWTFRSRDALSGPLLRFVAVYSLGYGVNFTGLRILVDRLNLPHQASQAALIVLVAAILFLLQRNWVFRRSSSSLQ